MRLKQSRLAEADLVEIFEHGVDNFGVEVALEYLDRIEERFRQLIAYPKSGRAEPAIHPQIRSLACKAHRIYYSIEGDTITIRRILHMSMDAQRWLE
jgi:toxin ParE1/3/4